MSDTPRCDAYEVREGIRYNLMPRYGMPDWPAFARQLECEVAALREAAREAQAALGKVCYSTADMRAAEHAYFALDAALCKTEGHAQGNGQG